ncbi:MAG TPA: HAD family acid phosphatase [Baekduia sp.]
MNRLLALFAAAAALAVTVAPVASAQDATSIPAPTPVLTKIGSTPMIELNDGGGGLPYLGTTTSYNAGDLKAALTSFHDSGVYDTEIAQIDGLAAKYVTSSGHQWKVATVKHATKARTRARAAHNGNGNAGGNGNGHGSQWWNQKPAIVFDIDETALSNYSAIVADGFVYGPKSQAEATDEIGTAIKPTLDLYNLAKSKGITPFFVTGRPEAQRAPTEDNLKREGYADWKQLFLKPAGFSGTTVQYKTGARTQIEQQGYHVVASVGDQYSDLAGGHADTAFKLPNPFYFLP